MFEMLDIERFKEEKSELVCARDEYLSIVEVNFVVWVGLDYFLGWTGLFL